MSVRGGKPVVQGCGRLGHITVTVRRLPHQFCLKGDPGAGKLTRFTLGAVLCGVFACTAVAQTAAAIPQDVRVWGLRPLSESGRS